VLRKLLTSASISLARRSLCGLVLVRLGQHPQPRLLHLIQRAVLDVLLNLSQRPAVAKHLFDDRLTMEGRSDTRQTFP